MSGTRFLARTALTADESLESYLIRLSLLNSYQSTNSARLIATARLGARGWTDNMRAPRLPETYDLLEELTCVSRKQLYGATVHRFALAIVPPHDTPDSVDLADTGRMALLPNAHLTKWVRAYDDAAFCPLCLEGSQAYHKNSWSIRANCVCVKHGCLLETCCSECGSSLSITDVTLGVCHKCSKPLSRNAVRHVTEEPQKLAMHATMHAWLGLPDYGKADPLGLPDVLPRVLFNVVHGLKWSIGRSRTYTRKELGIVDGVSDETNRVAISDEGANVANDVLFHLLAAAFHCITDWPYNFKILLNRMERASERGLGLGTLYTQWIADRWSTSDYAFLQNEFDDWLAAKVIPSIARTSRYKSRSQMHENRLYVLPTPAMYMLRLGKPTFDQLVAKGTLILLEVNGERCLRLDEVTALRDKWGKAITLQQTCERLRVSKSTAINMIRLGMIQPVRGPTFDGASEWLLDAASVRLCLMNVLGAAHPVSTADEPEGRWLTIGKAAQHATSSNLTISRLLLAIRDGRLPAYWIDGHGKGIHGLRIAKRDLARFVPSFEPVRTVTPRHEVAARLGIKATVVSKWVTSGLLAPVCMEGNAMYFEKAQIDRFVADHIFTEEAATILGIGVLAVQNWARNGRLHPVAGPGVDRVPPLLVSTRGSGSARPE